MKILNLDLWDEIGEEDIDGLRQNGDGIVKTEWRGNRKTLYGEGDVGNHLIGLRVQDAEGNWSDWAEKTVTVYKEGDVRFYGVGDAVGIW